MPKNMDSCIFCSIVEEIMPSFTIYEDVFIKAILDINPCNQGHMLVIPKKHFQDLFDISEDYLQKLILVVKMLSQDLKHKFNYNDINIIQSSGKLAWQEIFHFHFHIIPRLKWDSITFSYEINQFAKNNLSQSFKSFTKSI